MHAHALWTFSLILISHLHTNSLLMRVNGARELIAPDTEQMDSHSTSSSQMVPITSN